MRWKGKRKIDARKSGVETKGRRSSVDRDGEMGREGGVGREEP